MAVWAIDASNVHRSGARGHMIEPKRLANSDEEVEGDFVVFHQTGDSAKGSFRCSDCGYGVVVTAALPRCPMCGGTVWEPSPWSPFTRAASVTPL